VTKWKSEGVQAKWDSSSWAKKRNAFAARAATSDFERFEIMLARKARSAARKAKLE
jgi:large subunit ribosomal protein L14e